MEGKTIFITGASRGIGRAIALKLAQEGANIVIAAKTKEPHPKLDGTIGEVAEEVEALGAKALALQLDVRDENAIEAAIAETVNVFGTLDVLINNASAISLTNTKATTMKKYDLMMGVNARATFACSRAAIDHLAKSSNAHILNLSPPLNMDSKWFKAHTAYTMSKYGMSMCTLGLHEELKELGIAVNSLWPKTTIATAAIQHNFPKEIMRASRNTDIMADAALSILTQDAKRFTGNFLIDEDYLRNQGVEDFTHYAVEPGQKLFTDLYVEQVD
mgnify:FL=1|jgi:citronellol/citronellal dehydrogenase